MLQRVQTIWMLIASIAVFITLKLSFFSGTLAADNTFDSLVATDTFLLMVLTCALGTAILLNIFLYKHRNLQFRFCIIAMAVECVLLFLYYRRTKIYSNGTLDIWAIVHLLVFAGLILAARGIYKDEKLVKDSNRLR